MRRICHVCGKEYEYPSADPENPSGLRRCADCLKKKKSNGNVLVDKYFLTGNWPTFRKRKVIQHKLRRNIWKTVLQ